MKNKINRGEVLLLGSSIVAGIAVSIAQQNPLEMVRFLVIGVGAWCILLGIKEFNTSKGE